ncbi:MAG: DUF1828 domain-containing protein [Armatimonadaceae bacterium]
MTTDIDQLLDRYRDWHRANTSSRGCDNASVVTVPMVDRHNDMMQVVVRHSGDLLEISDDGAVIGDLMLCGFSLETPARQAVLCAILAGQNVQRDGERLVATSTEADFPLRLHQLLQAMQSVDALALTGDPEAPDTTASR